MARPRPACLAGAHDFAPIWPVDGRRHRPRPACLAGAHDLALAECIRPPSSAERLIRRSNDLCRGRNERGRHRAQPEYHRVHVRCVATSATGVPLEHRWRGRFVRVFVSVLSAKSAAPARRAGRGPRKLALAGRWMLASIAPGPACLAGAHDLALLEWIRPPSSAERLIRRSNDLCRGRNERGRHRAQPEYHRVHVRCVAASATGVPLEHRWRGRFVRVFVSVLSAKSAAPARRAGRGPRKLALAGRWMLASIAPGPACLAGAHDLALLECIRPPSSAERLIRRSNDLCRGRNERGRHRAQPEYRRVHVRRVATSATGVPLEHRWRGRFVRVFVAVLSAKSAAPARRAGRGPRTPVRWPVDGRQHRPRRACPAGAMTLAGVSMPPT